MPPTRSQLPPVFLSYAEEDFRDARAFAAVLEDLARKHPGAKPPKDWCYLAQRNNQGGEGWEEKAYEEARRRRVFVLLVSPASLNSEWCLRREAWIAWQEDHLIVPVVLDGRRRRVWWNPTTWRPHPKDWERAVIECSDAPRFKEYCDREGLPHSPGSRRRLSECHGLPIGDQGPELIVPIRDDPEPRRGRAAEQLLETILAEGMLEPAAVFRCDQHTIRTKLKTAWEEAQGRALVLFLFGAANHCPGEFWRVALQEIAVQGLTGDGSNDEPLPVELGRLTPADAREVESRFRTELESRLGRATPPAPPTARCFRWHVGSCDSQIDMDWLEVGIRGLGQALGEVMKERFPAPPDPSSPPLVLAVIVESNFRAGRLVQELAHCHSRVHAVALPAFDPMNHEHVKAWATPRVGIAEPGSSGRFGERARRLVSKLKRDRSTLDYEQLKKLCVQHHLIHAEP